MTEKLFNSMKIWIIKIIVLAALCISKISCGLEASAVLLECEKGSSKDDIKKTSPPYHTIDNCTRKIRITLNITNTGKTPEDLDYSFLNQLSDPGTGINLYLLNPIVLRLRQDQVILAYPFNYLSAVNAKAKEIVVNYENRKNYSGCDDTSQINPTCGVKFNRGKSIPYSQGFCCFCPDAPVKIKQTRGGQDCSLDVGDPADVEKQKFKASAHCLHLSDIWYSVSALSDPNIIHETYIQVYNQRHLNNGSSVWVALTHDEDFELGYKNPYQYDENKTILISYLTDSPSEKSLVLPIQDRRLLTPQPMPAVELSKLPDPVKNGATDYLLIAKDLINSDGDACNVAGISFEGFAKQNDRCEVSKDTCLDNQPLDFWEMDDERRKSGAKGSYILENFGIPHKDPIIIHPDTKEHWLGLEYHEPHTTNLIVEINADEIAIMNVGKKAQISKIVSAQHNNNLDFYVSILNRGMMPAKLSVKVTKCAFSVSDSNSASVVVPPQMTENLMVSTKTGSVTLDEEFTCTVQVSSEFYGVIATREVKINPFARCICNFHCECACLSDSLKCESMSEEDFHKAGFQGSLPILTAKPPLHYWFVKHPGMSLAALVLILLMIGFIKGLFGLAGVRKIGDYGLKEYLYQPKKIKGYQQPDLKKVEVEYDDDGYPVHPDTKERVRVISEELLFLLNCLFLFFWPCKKCCKGKPKAKKGAEDILDEEATTDSEKSDTPKKKRGFFGRGHSKPPEEKPKEDKPPKEDLPKKGFFGRRAKPPEDKPTKEEKEGPPKERKGFFGRRPPKPSEDKPPKEGKEGPPKEGIEDSPKEGKGLFGKHPAKPPKEKPPKEDKETPPKERKGFFGRRPAKPSEDKPPKEDKPSKEDKPPKEEKPPKPGKGFFGRGRSKPEDKPPEKDPSVKDEDKKAKKRTEGVPAKEGTPEKGKDEVEKKPSGDSLPKDDTSAKAQDEMGDKQQGEKEGKQQEEEKTDEQPPADETIDDTKLRPVVTRPVRPSLSDSDLDTREVSTGPVADPLNKELERWQKGTGRIHALRK